MTIKKYSADESRQDICPECGAEDSFEWGYCEMGYGIATQEFTCEECGATGREIRKFAHGGYEIDTEA